MSELIFQNHTKSFNIRWEMIVGWRFQIAQRRLMVNAPKDSELAKKGEKIPDPGDRVELTETCTLYLAGMGTSELNSGATVEFKRFLKEKIQPEYWRPEEEGLAEVQIMGRGGAA